MEGEKGLLIRKGKNPRSEFTKDSRGSGCSNTNTAVSLRGKGGWWSFRKPEEGA